MSNFGSSSMPFLKSALIARLQARTGLQGVDVTWGNPGRKIDREWLRVGGAEGAQETHAMGPTRSRRETYDLEMFVSVLRSADEQMEATLRAFEIMAEVEQELRPDPSVGGVVIRATIGGGLKFDELANGDQRECAIDFHIDVEARV